MTFKQMLPILTGSRFGSMTTCMLLFCGACPSIAPVGSEPAEVLSSERLSATINHHHSPVQPLITATKQKQDTCSNEHSVCPMPL